MLLFSLIAVFSLIEAEPFEAVNATSTTSNLNEQRLRDRWNAFVAERNKPLAFDDTRTSLNTIEVVRGKDLFITCAFDKPLTGAYKLSFMRLNDLSLIAVGSKMHMEDARMSTLELDKGWTLRIKDADVADSAVYECQLNAQPRPLRRQFNVKVHRAEVGLEDNADNGVVYVDAGSDLRLTCVVRSAGAVRPEYMGWYKDDTFVEYNEAMRDHAEVEHDLAHRRSVLFVRNAKKTDSGLYRCDSDLTGDSEAAVDVYVVSDDSNELEVRGAPLEEVISNAASKLEAATTFAVFSALILQ